MNELLYVQSTSGREFVVSSSAISPTHPLESVFIVSLVNHQTTWELGWHVNRLKWNSIFTSGVNSILTDTEATEIGEYLVAYFK